MNQPMKLSLEQEFSLRSFADQVQHMSHEQAQEFLVSLYKQMMLKETMYKYFLKHTWGLDGVPLELSRMDDEQFHTVDPKFLKSITVNDILTGKSILPTELDYSVPVPTRNQSLPRSNREAWLRVEMGNVDVAAVTMPEPGNRGRIGGC